MEEFDDFEEYNTCEEWECHEFPTQEELEELQKEMEEHYYDDLFHDEEDFDS